MAHMQHAARPPPAGVTQPVRLLTGWPLVAPTRRLLSTPVTPAGCGVLIRGGSEPKDEVH
jgi:hypothetical protein